MIPYKIPHVEVIGKYSLKPFALIEPSQCWFEVSYYEAGEFEIYAPVTSNNLNALKNGNYVKIPNLPYIWVIKNITYTFNSEGAKVIDAKGFEAKWILHYRYVLDPINSYSTLLTTLSNLFTDNVFIAHWDEARRIRTINFASPPSPQLQFAIESIQIPREDLFKIFHDLLKTNKCGFYTTYQYVNNIGDSIIINPFEGRNLTGKSITYNQGTEYERTINSEGILLFSQSMDNLITADYFESSEEKKTFCRVVSSFTEKNSNDENINVDYPYDYDQGATGIDRIELVINSNISTKYVDNNGDERETTPTSDLYQSWQREEARNKLAECIIKKEFKGDIDLNYTKLKFGTDFFIGDMVLVKDEFFGFQESVRILKYTFKQDASGYGEEIEYGTE